MYIITKLKIIIKNILFFSDFKIWIKILKDSSPKNNTYNWTSGKLDLYTLRKIIKINNPKLVLELGSGIGVSSEAILDQINKDSKLITIENNKKCIELLKKRLEIYDKNYEIIESGVELSKEKINIETMIYKITKNLNVDNIDLIYIDGPSWTFDLNNNFITGIPRGDFFYFYEKIKVGTIIILDGSYITRKQIHRFCRSIKFLKIYKSFSFKKMQNDLLNDSNYNKLKKWKYID